LPAKDGHVRNLQPPAPAHHGRRACEPGGDAARGWWYQYYFATERGRKGLEKYRRDIARVLWKTNSPQWQFDDATFERTAASFDHPDYVHIVIHNYRWRLSLAPGFPRYEPWERRLAEFPGIAVPTITMDGSSDGVVPATDGKAHASMFIGARSHRIVDAGHNVPQEAPQAFADAVWELAAAHRTGASR
jgi:pimeloyl-ACP methyl ester carboxylesterase